MGPPDIGKREHGGAMSAVRSLQIVWLKVDLNDGLEVVLVVQAAVSARLLTPTTIPIFGWNFKVRQTEPRNDATRIMYRAYRKAGYLTMVIAGYIPANSQLAAAIATIVKSLSIGK